MSGVFAEKVLRTAEMGRKKRKRRVLHFGLKRIEKKKEGGGRRKRKRRIRGRI